MTGQEILEDLLSEIRSITNQAEFNKKRHEILDSAFDKVLACAESNIYEWRRESNGLRGQLEVVADAVLPMDRFRCISFKLLLFGVRDDYGMTFCLYLGDKTGPCRNNTDIRVANLAKKVFGDIS